MKTADTTLSWILLLAVIISLVTLVSANFSLFRKPFPIAKYQLIYDHSQYNVPQNEFRGNIDDPQLYSLAGYRYIHGADPVAVNFEHQPLVKYYFGLSILLFGNAVVGQFLLALLLLALVFLAGKKLFRYRSLALLSAFLVSVDPLFRQQAVTPYLDLGTVVGLLAFFWIFFQALEKRRSLLGATVLLGLSFLTDSFFIGLLAYFTAAVYLVLFHRGRIWEFFRDSIVIPFLYCLGYTRFFFYHPPWDLVVYIIREIRLYKSYVPEYPKGEVFRIIFTGYWRRWFGDFGLMSVPQWNWLWPAGTVAQLILTVRSRQLARTNPFLTLLILWSLVWLFAISLKLVFPRYLTALLPFWSLFLVYLAAGIGEKLFKLAPRSCFVV